MVSARNALQSVENAIGGVRRDEDRLAAALRSSTDEVARMRLRQAESLKALAGVRLDSLQRGEVTGSLDRAERAALKMLDERRRHLEEIETKRGETGAALEAREAERFALVGKVEALHGRIDELEGRVEGRLQDNTEWQAQDAKAQKAAEVARAASEKADAAEADLDSKGAPYRDDRLFMYLWNNGFGTSRYAGGRLARYFDRKIARLIGFEAARRDFAMLNEIPVRLRQHAGAVAQKAEAEQAALEAIERRELEADGIAGLEAELAGLQQQVAGAEADIATLNGEMKTLDDSQKSLSDPAGDSEFQQVIAMMADALGREDLRTLWNEARRTPTPEDETIVRELEELDRSIERTETEIEETRRTALKLADKRAELERSRDRFHRSGYDDPTGTFSNGDIIGEVIGGILTGAMSSGALDEVFKKGFRRGRSPGRSRMGGSVRMPSPGPWAGAGTPQRETRAPKPQQPRSKGGFRTGGSF